MSLLSNGISSLHLDPQTASYWQGRHGLRRRRRIGRFTSNFYRAGLLGSIHRSKPLVARLNGVNPRVMLKARTLEEQRHIFRPETRAALQSARVALAGEPSGFALWARHTAGTI